MFSRMEYKKKCLYEFGLCVFIQSTTVSEKYFIAKLPNLILLCNFPDYHLLYAKIYFTLWVTSCHWSANTFVRDSLRNADASFKFH